MRMKLEEFPQSDNPVQCSCCDYFSLAESGKSLICPVCYWEDDTMDSTNLNLDAPSDLNDDMTLREARENFNKFGAFNSKWSDIVISESERETIKYEARNV